MKIAYIIYPEAIISGASNGIKSQAKSWKKGIENLGHHVTEINIWSNYNLKSFDVIHIFGSGLWLYNFVKHLANINKNIVLSPIVDSTQSKFLYKFSTFVGFKKLRLWSPTYVLKKTLPMLKAVYVRSNHEKCFFTKSMNYDSKKIRLIPLSFDTDLCSEKNRKKIQKENFCLHISSIYQKRKNVIRLIKAAKKYNFNLVLAGEKGTEKQFKPIKEAIADSKIITFLGFISEEKMINLFNRAKVFALPSINEGVGIVAVNAAYFGCEIVITNFGGPKEYFGDLAENVNPFSVDEIGRSIKKCLAKKINTDLESLINLNNNANLLSRKLEKSYLEIL